MIIITAILVLTALGCAAVLYGTLVRNKWGINTGDASCPTCGTPLPKEREPRSARQAMWGGWTCTECGAEVDKWGREIQRADHAELSILGQYKSPSRIFWAISLSVVILIAFYDYHHRRAITLDLIVIVALIAWRVRS
jgi:hypothetical protein